MSEPYVGEIRMFAGTFAPQGWALCDGSILSISENEVLFTLLGTTYGGDGQSTFALPDLRGRVPVHTSGTIPLGSKGGTETVTLTSSELPAHTHDAIAVSVTGDAQSPANALWATSPLRNYWEGTPGAVKSMNGGLLSPAGGSQPHDNMMPSLTLSFIIALNGLYPTPN